VGANVFQDRGGSRTFTDRFDLFTTDTAKVHPDNDAGFFGGIKLGYVFGTGIVRPTIEGDFFYNGFRADADFRLREVFDPCHGFQPYAGAGVGGYYAESANVEINTPTHVFSASGGENHADFAWQVLAGTDYYWNPKLSSFIEYHYLDYTSSQIDTREDRDLGQHLLGAGLRLHF
jgi:opacity protein-like surface antigen